MNIYLNIDGVLISESGQAAFYADEFLNLIIKKWPGSIYWLTMQSRGGRFGSHEALKNVLKPATYARIRTIQPGAWRELKTDAIDFTKPFLWFDEHITPEENQILSRYQAEACFRQVNLRTDPHQLMDEIVLLRSLA